MKNKTILTINPGSTSTKIAIYVNNDVVFLKSISHKQSELDRFERISEQYSFRKEIILEELKNTNISVNDLDIIMSRGGLVKPIESGVYEVTEKLRKDLEESTLGEHASNLGGLIAYDIAKSIVDVKAYIADPVVIDELDELARYTGHPEFKRISIFHALNHKAIGRTHAKSIGKQYEDLNLIIAHLGGGISVGAHKKGRVVDVNQALDGEGPFSPERTGTLPSGDLVRLCFSGKYSEKEVLKIINGKGGFVAYLGTNNAYEIQNRVKLGDENAEIIQEAMAYQVSKEIGSMASVLEGEVDAILLTGGIAFNDDFVNSVRKRTEYIASVGVYPGEDEMKALAMNGLLLLNGEIEAKEY